ncbi:MAG: NlpC/P60 family protein [Bdellovibrionales bacterium]
MADNIIHQVIADSVVMTATPDFAAEASSELLFGEQVEILETCEVDDEPWARIRSQTDGYEGYVQAGALDDEPSTPSHKVAALRSFAFCEPDYKSPPLRILSFFSPLSVVLEDRGYCLLEQGGWVFEQHVQAFESTRTPPIDAALMFLETPYLWGGRSAAGLDCSALVQLALLNAGIPCPRDSKDQEKAVGQAIERDQIQRGDLVFFKGHVGMMVDDHTLINATARHMKVLIEPLAAVEKAYDGITTIRRVV